MICGASAVVTVVYSSVHWWTDRYSGDILVQTDDRSPKCLSTSPVHPDGSPVLAQVNQPTIF
jgi:hypothetical protein